MTGYDYRAFADCPVAVVSSGTLTADTTGQNGGVILGKMLLICLADASLTGVVFQYPKNGVTVDTAIPLKAGAQLPSVKSCTVASGQVMAIYFV